MQLEHEFVVPVPVDRAWEVLLDVERIAPCMPGATVESFDGENVSGKVKVKVGPIQVTYAGQARFKEKDEAERRLVLDANGKEARGSGTASATITARMADEGGRTRVTVHTDLAITGRPAQFGRGVMVEVGNKLLGRFADCLAEQIGGPAPAAAEIPAPAVDAGAPAPAPTVDAPAVPIMPTAAPPGVSASVAAVPAPLRRSSDDDAIDLLDTAGIPVLKRVAPAGVAFVLFVLLVIVLRRRRR